MIMITSTVIEEFEQLWKRRGIFHVDLTYGQALAQYTKCTREDPDSLFLCTSPYPAIMSWVEQKINANTQIQAEAVDRTDISAAFKNSN